MLMSCVVLGWLLCKAQLPMVFLGSEDIEDGMNVRVEAQLPDSIVTLVPKDIEHPSLWYSPAAAHEHNGEVWVWYQRVDKSVAEYMDQRALCLGVIRDGQWRLPELSPESPAWGGSNNVVMRRSPHKPTWGGFNVFQITPVGRGYQMLYWDQPNEKGDAGAMLARSQDGVRWSIDPPGTVFTEHNDAFSLLPVGKEFLLFQTALEEWPDKPYPDNLDKKRRVISLRMSKDLVHWSPQDVLLRPDAADKPETEFYLMKAFPYVGRYAGVLFKYYADPASPKKHSAIYVNELIVSDDARNWRRPFRDVALPFWTYAEPFTDSGRLCFVAGFQQGAIVMPTYRLFGLTAVAVEGEGAFTIPAVNMPSRGLLLHADVRRGWIEARAISADGAPEKEIAVVRAEQSDAGTIALAPPQDLLKDHIGIVRILVRMKDAKLYAITTVARADADAPRPSGFRSATRPLLSRCFSWLAGLVGGWNSDSSEQEYSEQE